MQVRYAEILSLTGIRGKNYLSPIKIIPLIRLLPPARPRAALVHVTGDSAAAHASRMTHAPAPEAPPPLVVAAGVPMALAGSEAHREGPSERGR
eukprot:scaffold2144_cov334-Prasinococcus_capsulatus_cf.AAC.6